MMESEVKEVEDCKTTNIVYAQSVFLVEILSREFQVIITNGRNRFYVWFRGEVNVELNLFQIQKMFRRLKPILQKRMDRVKNVKITC